jgi:dolichyl-phosphate-mannose--protein O-mannosyl transferase
MMINDNIWQGIASSDNYADNLLAFAGGNEYKRFAQKTVILLLEFLEANLGSVIKKIRINLVIKQGDADERLARGINENGLIKPDFGKSFIGIYFLIAIITIRTHDESGEGKNTFLKKYVEGLVIDYFIQHPSDYSNWEFNHRNRKASGHANMAARNINFPEIQIHVE